MKNWSIFVRPTKTLYAVWVAGIIISAHIGRYNYGLPIPRDFCTQQRRNVLVDTKGIARPFFRAIYSDFLFAMTKTTKNCGTVNHSTRTSTCAHDTSERLYSKFQIEKDAKNHAYAFILSRGLLSEFTEYSRAHSGQCQSLESRLEMTLKNC